MTPEPLSDPNPFRPELVEQLPAVLPSAAAIAGDLVVPGLAGDETTPDFVELALAGLKPSSKEGYRKELIAFNRFLSSPESPGPLNRNLGRFLTLATRHGNTILMSWVCSMQDECLSPATIRRRIASVKRLLKGCRIMGLTDLVVETILPRAEAFRDTAGPGLKGWQRLLAWAQREAETALTSPGSSGPDATWRSSSSSTTGAQAIGGGRDGRRGL